MQSFFQNVFPLCLIGLTGATSSGTNHRRTIEGVPPLLFSGILLDDLQAPISDAQIQFWQADPNGLYDHPDADEASLLDSTFQYFGTAKTRGDGSFSFLTHRPGIYAGRPTHFHYKVWVDGENVLTSQFYFADEDTNYSDMQIIELEAHEFDDGNFGFSANKTIVVDLNLGGDGPFTPSDIEGPYYPVIDFFKFDNDLINESLNCADANQADYRGTIAVTVSGRSCQAWESQSPHVHRRTPDHYPNAGLESNYCRNPDGKQRQSAWCYTMDPLKRWEFCDVPTCTVALEAAPSSVATKRDCITSMCAVELSPDLLMEYAVVVPDTTNAEECEGCAISVKLSYSGDAWIGFGFSTDGAMVGSQAVIGSSFDIAYSPLGFIPNPFFDEPLQKYNLSSTEAIISLPKSQQTLTNTSIKTVSTANGVKTVMKFTKLLKEEGEIEVFTGNNTFIWAHGDNGYDSKHADRGTIELNLFGQDTGKDNNDAMSL